MRRARQFHALLLASAGVFAFPALVAAQPIGGQPWVDAAQQIAQLLTGPLASAILVIAVAIVGYLFMFGEAGSKRALALVIIGGALTLAAPQVVSWLFPGATGP